MLIGRRMCSFMDYFRTQKNSCLRGNASLVLSRYSTNLMSSNICLVFTIFIWLSET